MNQSESLKEFKKIHEVQELWEEHGRWERWWCEKCGALYEWNSEMDEPSIEIPPRSRSCELIKVKPGNFPGPINVRR